MASLAVSTGGGEFDAGAVAVAGCRWPAVLAAGRSFGWADGAKVMVAVVSVAMVCRRQMPSAWIHICCMGSERM